MTQCVKLLSSLHLQELFKVNTVIVFVLVNSYHILLPVVLANRHLISGLVDVVKH